MAFVQPTFDARATAEEVWLDDDDASSLRGEGVLVSGGLAFTPTWAVVLTGELGIYDTRSDRIAPGGAASTRAFGVSAIATTNPDGAIGLHFELGAGFRHLRLPYDTGVDGAPHGVDTFSGFEPLRVHVGPSIALGDRWRLDLLAGFTLGRFSGNAHPETCAVVASCKDSFDDPPTRSATYVLADLSIAIRWL